MLLLQRTNIPLVLIQSSKVTITRALRTKVIVETKITNKTRNLTRKIRNSNSL